MLRALVKRPGFAAVVVARLALGLGATVPARRAARVDPAGVLQTE